MAPMRQRLGQAGSDDCGRGVLTRADSIPLVAHWVSLSFSLLPLPLFFATRLADTQATLQGPIPVTLLLQKDGALLKLAQKGGSI